MREFPALPSLLGCAILLRRQLSSLANRLGQRVVAEGAEMTSVHYDLLVRSAPWRIPCRLFGLFSRRSAK